MMMKQTTATNCRNFSSWWSLPRKKRNQRRWGLRILFWKKSSSKFLVDEENNFLSWTCSLLDHLRLQEGDYFKQRQVDEKIIISWPTSSRCRRRGEHEKNLLMKINQGMGEQTIITGQVMLVCLSYSVRQGILQHEYMVLFMTNTRFTVFSSRPPLIGEEPWSSSEILG